MAKIVRTEESRWWLSEIRAHIAKDSVAAADRTVEGIYEKAQLLKNFPELGFQYPLPGRVDVRVLLYGHYRIAYVLTQPDEICVLGIFHSALDIDRFFPDEQG